PRHRPSFPTRRSSDLEQPDGSRLEVFGSGGGQRVADRLTETLGAPVPLLGQVPLDISLREGSDSGVPVVLTDPDSSGASVLRERSEEHTSELQSRFDL